MRTPEESFYAAFAGMHDEECFRCDEGCCCTCWVSGCEPAVTDLVRERDAEVRADERAKVLAGFAEWYAPAYTAPNGNTCPIGPETVAREFAESDARDMASPEDETPVYVARRLVGPWESTDRGD